MTMGYTQLFAGGSSIPLWFSGMTVRKYEAVMSAADGEIYRRLTADGAGALDPADDITNYAAISFRRTLSIPSRASATASANNSSIYAQGTTRVSPAITANTRTLLFSAAGRGQLGFLGVAGGGSSGPAGNCRVEVIIDGRTVLDATISFAAVSRACTLIGVATGTPGSGNEEAFAWFDPAAPEFRRTCIVYVTPSVTTSAGLWNYVYSLRGYA